MLSFFPLISFNRESEIFLLHSRYGQKTDSRILQHPPMERQNEVYLSIQFINQHVGSCPLGSRHVDPPIHVPFDREKNPSYLN